MIVRELVATMLAILLTMTVIDSALGLPLNDDLSLYDDVYESPRQVESDFFTPEKRALMRLGKRAYMRLGKRTSYFLPSKRAPLRLG
uniref:Short neuropeptide F n=1 Tax=Panagrellus redivivus TaxID=6233 RepID=A0A7E4ZSF9_PANRE